MIITLDVTSYENGSPILYVGGLINGESYVFEESDGLWRVNVPKSEDDYYHLDLQMVDEAGNTSSYQDTLYYQLPSFVYDRTQEDINSRTRKAYINADDLNRIGRMEELVAGYLSLPVNVRYWEIGEIPRESDFDVIQSDLLSIRGVYSVYEDTPEVPTRPWNTYQKWNAIERILHDVFTIYIENYNSRDVLYCGDGEYCGDSSLF